MNGIQVARELRRNLESEVPILLISAYDWSNLEAEALGGGISGFISKPLFKSTLFYALRQYMELIHQIKPDIEPGYGAVRAPHPSRRG